MKNKLDVVWKGNTVGEAWLTEERSRLLLNASADMASLPENTAVHMSAVCGGERIHIGVPVPNSGQLNIKKLISAEKAKRIEYIEVYIPGDEKKSESLQEGGWSDEYDPGRLFADAELKIACESIIGAKCREEGADVTLLAVPADSRQPFPLLPVFMYGFAQRIGERMYAVFKLKNGIIVR